jgi:hypothetical protein
MIDPESKPEPGDTSTAPDKNLGSSWPASNTAAPSDMGTAPQVPINPDDLHDLFSGSPSADGIDDEDPLAQMRKDPNYAALISELEYIAAQARLLFAPAEETPSDDLWKKIESQLPAKPEEPEE